MLTKNHETLKEGLTTQHRIEENKLIEYLKAAETRLIKDLGTLQVSDN
ncbi:hypothetical protein [Bacillus sp. AFS002410]|nr:hypothetical protein [Bacillus sp. AFS002410]